MTATPRPRKLKVDYVHEIAELINVDPPHMSTGSTEPRAIFDLVNDAFGLGIDDANTKPELAREIVLASGKPWNANYESRGGTVTLTGLQAVRDAVLYFTTAQ